MSEKKEAYVANEIADELQLQAWLARKELSHPSLKHDDIHEQATVLARMRDELRLQAHLGKLDAQDELERIEERWKTLMRQDVEPAVAAVASSLEEVTRSLLDEIRKGYHALVD